MNLQTEELGSAEPMLKDVETAITSLTALGSAALGVAGVSSRVAGVTPDPRAN